MNRVENKPRRNAHRRSELSVRIAMLKVDEFLDWPEDPRKVASTANGILGAGNYATRKWEGGTRVFRLK